jgi:hypothetical protein
MGEQKVISVEHRAFWHRSHAFLTSSTARTIAPSTNEDAISSHHPETKADLIETVHTSFIGFFESQLYDFATLSSHNW